MNRPPRFWRRLLRVVVPPGDRETLVDELDRMFVTRRSEEGPSAAKRWYRSEVLDFVRQAPGQLTRSLVIGSGAEATRAFRGLGQTLRSLRRAPGFSSLTSGTLALGIGAGALIVGIADRALFRQLPYPEPDRIVAVLEGWGTSPGSVEVMQAEMSTVVALGAASNANGMTWERPGRPPLRVSVANLTPGYLEALGVAPAVGRLFTPEDSRPGAFPVALLGDPFWREHFSGRPTVPGETIVLDGQPHEIVGVLPTGFDLPSAQNDIWRPGVMDASNPGVHWGSGGHTVIARMKPGVTPAQVRQDVIRSSEAVRLANPLWTPNPGHWDEARVSTLQEARSRWVKGPLTVLLGAVALVLLVVSANVASLFLSRALSRSQSLTVRAALGAGSARLAWEQVLEVMVLTVGGLVAGLILAYGGLRAVQPHLPDELPGGAALDGRIVAITAGIALLTALAAATLPAMRVATHSPAPGLRASGRGGGASRSRRRATRILVGAQLAAAIVLVTSGGLLARTILALSQVDPGFSTEGRVTAQVHLPASLPTDPGARASYYEALETSILDDPGISSAALASSIPFGAEVEYVATSIDGVTMDPNDLPVIPHHRVSPSFFEVTGISLLRGRPFGSGDRVDAPLVAIVDETFEELYLSGASALGQTVRYPWRGAPPMEVVGVTAAVHHEDLASPPQATMWVPLAQMGFGALGHATAVARPRPGAGSADALVSLSGAVGAFDNRIAISDLVPYDRLLARSLAQQRLMMILLVLFAGTALILGCVGVYGVAAFSVRQRIREFGVRLALGASAPRIRRSVLGDGLRLAVPGTLIGLLLAVPAARGLESMLYGVRAFDPVTFLAAPIALGAAAMVAAYVPARRAMRVDPAVVLREE